MVGVEEEDAVVSARLEDAAAPLVPEPRCVAGEHLHFSQGPARFKRPRGLPGGTLCGWKRVADLVEDLGGGILARVVDAEALVHVDAAARVVE